MLVVGYFRNFWLITAYRQTYRIRVALLQAVLRQEIGWFDTHDAGELGSRLAESVLFSVLCLYVEGRHVGAFKLPLSSAVLFIIPWSVKTVHSLISSVQLHFGYFRILTLKSRMTGGMSGIGDRRLF